MPQYSAEKRMQLTAEAVQLRARKWTFAKIARQLGITHPTAKKWIEDEYARRGEYREGDREEHLAVYDEIQRAAWQAFEDTAKGSLNRSGYLNTIKAAEDSKVKITGVEAPKRYQHVEEETEVVWDDIEVSDFSQAES